MRQLLSSIIVFGVLQIVPVRAQQVILPLDKIGQKADRLCWAAAIAMAANYYGPSTPFSQCDAVFSRMRFMQPFPVPTYPADCTAACGTVTSLTGGGSSSVIGSFNPSYNNPLDFTWDDGSGYIHPAWFDLILADFGYHSMEDYNLLSWDEYKLEIDSCRPSILIYDVVGIQQGEDPSTETPPIHHSVVAHGYYIADISDPEPGEFFYITDPWEVCDGQRYLLNKNALVGQVGVSGTVLTVNRILSMVHHIVPKNGPICNTCSLFPADHKQRGFEESILANFLRRHEGKMSGTGLGDQFSSQEMDDFNKESHYSAKIDFLSYDFFIKGQSYSEQAFRQAVLPTNTQQVTYTDAEQPINARVRCTNDGKVCTTERIELSDRASLVQQVTLPDGTKMLLSNERDPEVPTGVIPIDYSIVEYYPFTFRFYRFVHEGQPYYFPVEPRAKVYFYGVENSDARVAIPEKTVFNGLEKHSCDFPWNEAPKPKLLDKLEKLLDKDGFFKVSRILKRTGR